MQCVFGGHANLYRCRRSLCVCPNHRVTHYGSRCTRIRCVPVESATLERNQPDLPGHQTWCRHGCVVCRGSVLWTLRSGRWWTPGWWSGVAMGVLDLYLLRSAGHVLCLPVGSVISPMFR